METPLKSANLTVDDLTASILPDYEEESEAESHIHMPGPSLWPLLLGVAIFITFIGLLIIDSTPVIAIVGALAVLVGILGFGLENPMAHHEEQAGGYVTQDSPEAQQTLEQAREIVESLVTVGSTAWSAHPVTVEIEGDGVILALYGKVELEAQRREIEDALLQLPHVAGVKNFIVAEDAILNDAYARIEKLREAGKLEGAQNITLFVENYVINLYGDVPTREMKYMLENELIGIPGVRVVVNHIGLNEEIPGNLGKTRNKVGK